MGLEDKHKLHVGSDCLGSVFNLQNSPLFPNNMGAVICTNSYDLFSLMKMKRYLGLAKILMKILSNAYKYVFKCKS